SDRSLIQTAGRTARNLNGRVIMYADTVTGSMRRMLDETNRRRQKQTEYNRIHNITPKTIYKSTEEILASTTVADVKSSRDARREKEKPPMIAESIVKYMTVNQRQDLLEELKLEMRNAAKDLEFERAAELRDEISRLEKMIK
ncbi:MAG TPA: UvrB/UvrC motif-containing protein, partial [Bacteroidota bacterium]|nr:UvrB/UvrC motif-containing protein [Bacteroidota bacterium]